MKNIVRILSFAALVAVLVSCDVIGIGSGKKYTYKTSDFVRFDESTCTVQEDTGVVRIPISLYGKEGANCTVAIQGVNGTAVEGKDFKIVSETGIYTLTSLNPKDTVDVQIICRTGELTGTLNFSLKMTSVTNDVTRGNVNTLAVTIKDIDGPTAPVLGTYNVACGTPFGNSLSYTTSIVSAEDEANLYKVFIIEPIYAAYNYASWGGKNGWRAWGIVSEDLKTISVPLGQTLGEGTEEPAWYASKSDIFPLATYSISGGQIVPSTDGSLSLVWDDSKGAFVADKPVGSCAQGIYDEVGGSYNVNPFWQVKGTIFQMAK